MPVDIPPLRVWTFIPVTGQIISRQVIVDDGGGKISTPGKEPRKVSPLSPPSTLSTQSPLSPEAPTVVGTTLPSVVQPKGTVVTPGKRKNTEPDGDEEQSDPDGEAEPEEGGDLSIEDELAKLEALQSKGRAGKKNEAAAKKKVRAGKKD
jgi:hypothetical protein